MSTLNNHRRTPQQSNNRRLKPNPVTLLTLIAVSLGVWSLVVRSQLSFSEQQQEQQVVSSLPSDVENNKKGICFVQSVFGKPGQKSLDRPHRVTTLRQENPEYHFFYFTNMPTLIAPGWDKVLLTNMTHHRYITQSRWAKFLGWKYKPIMDQCRFVMYLDGHVAPRRDKQLKFQILARNTLNSKYGLIQTTHPKGGSLRDEFERIVSGTKDTQPHVDASLEWLEAQPDFYNNATLYWNAVFGE
jgi:hypothetical protein